ncbi:class I tRNA ligase family protein, partial [Candidatus Berkelbacteria bacterium]|nr:class I tRNA ligase family protein [Candidatus Berkelbacteria bacterium]
VTTIRVPPGTTRRYPLENFQRCPACSSWRTTRDPDTLDTWFSSGLWTFSTLGWPEPTPDLANYHPTQVLETAYEILFFWVARMILMTTALLGQIPFETVYLHGLVRDEKREKLSKSKGDSANPLDLIERFGADALRFGLIFNTAPGMDSVLSEEKIRGMRNFANKVWNVGRFIEMNRPQTQPASPAGGKSKVKSQNDKAKFKTLTEADAEIMKKLEETITKVTDGIEKYRPHEAAEAIYHFLWHDFADRYLEESKQQKDENTQMILLHIYRISLKLLHPFMPFVTETLWQSLGETEMEPLLMTASWPLAAPANERITNNQ